MNSRKRSTSLVRTSDNVQGELKVIYDTSDMTWRDIANLEQYKGVPPGTLSTIAKHGYVPKKWYHRFNIQEYKPAPACIRCGDVHTTRRCTANSNDRPRRQPPVRVANCNEAERVTILALSPSERKNRILGYMPEWY